MTPPPPLSPFLPLQAVLKRKTEEAEAARRKLRELTELQARVRRDKQAAQAALGDLSGGAACHYDSKGAQLVAQHVRACIPVLGFALAMCPSPRVCVMCCVRTR